MSNVRPVALRVLAPLVLVALGAVTGLVGAQAPAAPVLSPLEQLRVENLNLRHELRKALLEADGCRGALAQPRADSQQREIDAGIAGLKADVERAHPGFTWNPATGVFTPQEAPR